MFVDNNTERPVEQLSGISQISSGAMSGRYGIRSIIQEYKKSQFHFDHKDKMNVESTLFKILVKMFYFKARPYADFFAKSSEISKVQYS